MSEPAAGWFAIVDTARDPALHDLVTATPGHQCLIAGPLDHDLAAAMPYVVPLDDDAPLPRAWRSHGAGRSWGIMFRTTLRGDALRLHFKRFLQAKLPDGTIALFRFYDPRVFNTFIRAATPEERNPWFRDIAQFSVEGADGATIHHYNMRDGRLFDADTPTG